MNVLDELIDSENLVDRPYVERRVADWRTRIDRLYADVVDWLPSGWTGEIEGDLPFDEELMRRFAVAPQRLPLLRLRSSDQQARLEPRGLWIIGANGRVDLILSARHFLIIDRSEAFEASDWQVSSIDARRDEKPFDRDALLGALL